jgi:CRP-like cAMP-binding protein
VVATLSRYRVDCEPNSGALNRNSKYLRNVVDIVAQKCISFSTGNLEFALLVRDVISFRARRRSTLRTDARSALMPFRHKNLFLSGLLEQSRNLIVSHGTTVSLPRQTILYGANQLPRFAYFLTSGIASVVVSMVDGQTAEVGMIGSEGIVGAIHLLGDSPVPTNCFIQIEATAVRITMSDMQNAFNLSSEIRQSVLDCVQQQSNNTSQVAGCNRLHEAGARLARWLLTAQDITQLDVLDFTQEYLAEMIGAQRTTVTGIAGILQKHGLISYSRGRVHILSRQGLIAAACECYPVTRGIVSKTLGTDAVFSKFVDAIPT